MPLIVELVWCAMAMPSQFSTRSGTLADDHLHHLQPSAVDQR